MTDTYQNILVAIDGSEKAEKAFLEAIAIAKRNQATLHILYVKRISFMAILRHLLLTSMSQRNQST